MINNSKFQQDIYYKQGEYKRLCGKAEKGDAEALLRAGKRDGEEKVSISLDSLTPLPRCPQYGAKKTGRVKK